MKRLSWLMCIVLVSGCSWLGSGDDDNADNSSKSIEIEPANLVDFDEEIDVRKVWSNGGVGGIDWIGSNLKPALANGVIYAADSSGNVTAVSADSGDTLWDIDLDTSLSGGVGTGGGAVFVGSIDGEVFALAAGSGEIQWKATVTSEVLAAPVSNGTIVAVQSQDARLVGLDAASGEQVWQFQLSVPVLTLRGTSSPIIVGSTVIASFANGKVYGVAIDSGTQLWESRVAVPQGRTELERMVDIDGQPLLVDGVLFAVSYQGRLTAINRGTGRNLWYQDSSSHQGPAFGNNQVYVAEEGDLVRAFRANSGQVIWTNEQLTYRKLSAPAVVGGYVAVADGDGYLHVLSQTDGRFVGRVKVDGSGVSAPMISDGETLYVLDNDGGLTAYRFEDS